MKRKLKGLSQQYHAAVCKHVQQGPRASLLPAHDLGCQAAALELETLDVARIHEAAVAVLKMQVAEQFKKTEKSKNKVPAEAVKPKRSADGAKNYCRPVEYEKSHHAN